MSKGSKVRANLDRSRRPLTTTTHSVLIHTFLFEHQMVSPILLKIQQLHLTAAVTDKHSELCHQSVQRVPSTVSPSGLLLRFKNGSRVFSCTSGNIKSVQNGGGPGMRLQW